MPTKIEWTVRLVNFHKFTDAGRMSDELSGLWVEQLRYMGHAKEIADFDNRTVIEFYAPRGTDSRIWAKHNAERMQSFGLCAAAAPKWNGEGSLERVDGQLLSGAPRG